jgi:hypothetical protein
MLLFSTTEQSLPNDMINHITDFLTTGLFVLDGLCKSSRNLEDKQNPNVIKVSSFEVYLRIRHHHGLKFELDLSYSGITDVSDLRYVHTLNLTGCRNVTDVSSLIGVYDLNLTYCLGVADVSYLRNVHTLDLSFCYGVTDVSDLGSMNTLILVGCYKVTDVSKLGRVHTLDLTGCFKVTDFSMLGKNDQRLIR